MYGIELGIIIMCTLGCALASSSPAINAAWLLIFWLVSMVGLPNGPTRRVTADSLKGCWHRRRLPTIFSHYSRVSKSIHLSSLSLHSMYANDTLTGSPPPAGEAA